VAVAAYSSENLVVRTSFGWISLFATFGERGLRGEEEWEEEEEEEEEE
jgi:hypothetical protein